MNGSNLKVIAWAIPVLTAAGFTVRWLDVRGTDPTSVEKPPRVIAPVPSPRPAIPVDDAAAEHASYQHLRTEIAQLRQRIERRERQLHTAPSPASALPESQARPALTEDFLAPDQWQDAGNATPAALIETVLWAGAGGDIGRMGNLLDFSPDALAAAETLWRRVPPDLRPAGTDATALVALLATDSIPLAKTRLAGDFVQDNGDHLLVLRIDQRPPEDPAPAERNPRLVRLTARAAPASGGTDWRILVPPSAIAAWSARLDLPPPPDTPAGSE